MSKWGNGNAYQFWIDANGDDIGSVDELAIETSGGLMGTDYILPDNSMETLCCGRTASGGDVTVYVNLAQIFSGDIGDAS